MKNLDINVSEMRKLSGMLMMHSFPQVSLQEEEQISVLKQRDIVVDGYEIVVYFSKCPHMDLVMETVQLYGKYFTYLPMSVVVKVAKSFLGSKELSLMQTMHYRNQILDESSRKIYIWAVYYKDGGVVPNPFSEKFRQCSYEGFNYLSFVG